MAGCMHREVELSCAYLPASPSLTTALVQYRTKPCLVNWLIKRLQAQQCCSFARETCVPQCPPTYNSTVPTVHAERDSSTARKYHIKQDDVIRYLSASTARVSFLPSCSFRLQLFETLLLFENGDTLFPGLLHTEMSHFNSDP